MHKTFISYHHDSEQDLKDSLISIFGEEDFIDASVGDGDISEYLSEDLIMQIIREEYLQDSTVTLVLVGLETARRPFINSEIQASLRDTSNNKHNGILAVVRDEIYDVIYSQGQCKCNCSVRFRSSSFERYIPNLISKNNKYFGDKCFIIMILMMFTAQL